MQKPKHGGEMDDQKMEGGDARPKIAQNRTPPLGILAPSFTTNYTTF